MTQTAKQADLRFTYQDYILLPEDKRCELIEGDFYRTPAPLTIHQAISMKLAIFLSHYIEKKNLGIILTAPTDVVLSNENVVQPDILYISKEHENIITRENIQGAPDLVIEILSPATAQRDLIVKKHLYAKYAVQEYWIVDPDKKTIEVMTWSEKGFKTLQVYPANSHLNSPLFPEISLPVGDMFQGIY